MPEKLKCFCDTYWECLANPDRAVSLSYYDTSREPVTFETGTDFIESANKICPGTRVDTDYESFKSATVSADENTVSLTVARTAVWLRCTYLNATPEPSE